MTIFPRRLSRPQHRRVFLEALEDRNLLAGNINLTFAGGMLWVRGDGQANSLSITQSPAGLTLTGLDQTKINNGTSAVTRAGVQFLNIDMGSGADKLTIGNNATALTALAAGQPPGALVAADRVTLGGSITVNMGTDAAADQVNLIVSAQAGLTINAGRGADKIGIAGSVVRGAALLNADGGDSVADDVAIYETTVTSLLNILVGNGSDRVTLNGVQAGVTSINLGVDSSAQTNQLTIAGTTRASRLGYLTLVGGNGINNLAISDMHNASTTIFTGSANDSLSLQQSSSDYLFATLGLGNDLSIVNELGGRIGTIDGGFLGQDRLELGTTPGFLYFQQYGFEQVAPFAPLEEIEEGSAGTLSVQGIDPARFNPVGANVEVVVVGANWTTDLTNIVVFLNDQILPANAFSIVGNRLLLNSLLVEGRNRLEIYGADQLGLALETEIIAWAGNATLNVSVVDEAGAPITDSATVKLALGDDLEVFAQGTTTTGGITFSNLPVRTLQLSAQATGNRTGLRPILGDAGAVQLVLSGIDAPSTIANNDFSAGLDGWNIGTAPVSLVNHVENLVAPLQAATPKVTSRSAPVPPAAPKVANRNAPQQPVVASPVVPSAGEVDDIDLQLRTQGEGPQSISRTFTTQPGTKTVKMRYKFITSEIPGGYFGTQFNDGYVVQIRTLSGGGGVHDQQNMNGLGRAAFDANGATAWKELTIPVSVDGDTIQVDALVENIADGLLDSQLLIDKIEELSLAITKADLTDKSVTKDGVILYEKLQYLSVSPHTFFGGKTQVHGKLTIEGAETDKLTKVELEILQGGSVIATGQLSSAVSSTLLNQSFGADEKIEVTTDQLLFEINLNQSAFNVSWQDGQLLLRVKATDADGETVEKEFGNVTILSLYQGARQSTIRDGAVGGDGWVIPSIGRLLESVPGITVNDISNMNGGLFAPHAEHKNGRILDGKFAGYDTKNAATAATMLAHLNNPTYGSQIKQVYVTFNKTGADTSFWDAIKDVTLNDGRKASTVIKNIAKHSDHFHWVMY